MDHFAIAPLTYVVGLLPLCGARSFHSTPFVASMLALRVVGFTPLASRLPVTSLPSPVRVISVYSVTIC